MINNIPKESRYWHFRINDLSNEQLNYIRTANNLEFAIISNFEKDDEAKKTHYHVAVKFKTAITKSCALKRLLYNKNLHSTQYYLEPKYINSNIEQFVSYVIKNGIRERIGNVSQVLISDNNDNLEFKKKQSELDQDAKDELFEKRWKHAQMGDMDWFMENDRKFMMTANFNRLIANSQLDVNENLTHEEFKNAFIWIWGPPGTGKSSSIDYLYPNCYRKLKNNEKWDSYYTKREDHKIVYFDEMDSYEEIELCLNGMSGLKTISDIYPFPIRNNYGSRQIKIRPKKIIFTSNYHPGKVFTQVNKYGKAPQNTEMFMKAFKRRYKIYHINDWLFENDIYFDQKEKKIKKIDDLVKEIKLEHILQID